MLNKEDKADVSRAFGKGVASKVHRATDDSKSKALGKAKGGHKQAEREVRSKKAGFYVHGHKNYGDVYEA